MYSCYFLYSCSCFEGLRDAWTGAGEYVKLWTSQRPIALFIQNCLHFHRSLFKVSMTDFGAFSCVVGIRQCLMDFAAFSDVSLSSIWIDDWHFFFFFGVNCFGWRLNQFTISWALALFCKLRSSDACFGYLGTWSVWVMKVKLGSRVTLVSWWMMYLLSSLIRYRYYNKKKKEEKL